MPVAGSTIIGAVDALCLSPVARERQHRIEFIAHQLFDEFTNPFAYPLSIGSNQLSKRPAITSVAGCEESGFVVTLVMA